MVTGPTASGKTALAIGLARRLKCEIISADSRQLFHDLPIGTAAPTQAERAQAVHHFVGTLNLTDYYSAAQFEADALALLDVLFAKGDYAVMCGGSMMYVNAVTRGIDDLPTVTDDVRRAAYTVLETEGIDGVRARLRELDPVYYGEVDLNNHKRLVHALEICIQAGVPYSSLRTGRVKQRPFRILKVAFDYRREELFDRINRRVDAMLAAGFIEEVKRVYPHRELNALNTVGYKEMFAWLDGKWNLATAVARMAKNTRVYAKKQLTWLKRDPDVVWLDPHSPSPADEIMAML